MIVFLRVFQGYLLVSQYILSSQSFSQVYLFLFKLLDMINELWLILGIPWINWGIIGEDMLFR